MTTLDDIQERADATAKCFNETNDLMPILSQDRVKLMAALRAVEAVHVPEEYARSKTGLVCTHCIDAIAYDSWQVEYPCPTIRAITEALA